MLGFSESPVGSVDLWVLWMGTVLGPPQVLWRIWGPRVHQGIVVTGAGWFVLVTPGLWLTWILASLEITMVYLVLEQVTGTVVTVIPSLSVDSVGILESRVPLVPPVSVGSVVSVAAVVSVGSAVSSCLGLG